MINNGSAVLVKKSVQQVSQSPGVSRRKSLLENGDLSLSPLSVCLTTLGGAVDSLSSCSSSLTSSPSSVSNSCPASSHLSNGTRGSHSNAANGGVSQTSFHNHVVNSTACPATVVVNSTTPNNNATSGLQTSPQQYASPCPTCAAALLAPKKKKEDCCIK